MTKGNMKLLENPLGYFCAPNEATPDYVAEREVRKFLGWLCFDAQQGWEDKVRQRDDFAEFLIGVQTDALNVVEDALMRLQHGIEHDHLELRQDCRSGWEDLAGQWSSEVPGTHDEELDTEEDYRYNLQFRESEYQDCISIMIAAGTTNGDDRISWLDVETSKAGWYQSAIDEVRSARVELEVAHNKFNGIKTMPIPATHLAEQEKD